MKRIALLLVLAVACVNKPAPVATETQQPVDPALRPAIAVEFVAIPQMTVYKDPSVDAPVVGSYGMTEAVSILARSGEWSEIRTTSSTGWVKSAELITGDKLQALKDNPVPRFYVAPTAVETQARGEIVFQAKVNTDGEVVEVKTVKNTTGSTQVAELNAAALSKARFYPLIDQGQRKTFVYEHKVYYY